MNTSVVYPFKRNRVYNKSPRRSGEGSDTIKQPSAVLSYKTIKHTRQPPTDSHMLWHNSHLDARLANPPTPFHPVLYFNVSPSSMPATLRTSLPVCLSVHPPPLSEMKEKNPWHTPVTIIITVIGVIAIVALVTVAVLQNRPVLQKYKVC